MISLSFSIFVVLSIHVNNQDMGKGLDNPSLNSNSVKSSYGFHENRNHPLLFDFFVAFPPKIFSLLCPYYQIFLSMKFNHNKLATPLKADRV